MRLRQHTIIIVYLLELNYERGIAARRKGDDHETYYNYIATTADVDVMYEYE